MVHGRAGFCLAGVALAVLGSGCASVPEGGSESSLMKATNTKLGAGEIRAHTNDLANRVSAMIERSADEIAAQSTDPLVRRRALLWKIETIPVFYQALFRSDPLAAAADGYALSIQLEVLLESGPDRAAFGGEQPIALGTARSIRVLIHDDFRAIARSPAAFDKFEETVTSWARAHPVEGRISSRESMVPSLTALAGSGDTNVFGVIGDVSATLNDLTARLDIYTAFLPKQVRWQMELEAYQLSDRTEFLDALATLRSVHQLSDTANALFSPEGVRKAQDDLFQRLEGQRIAAMSAVNDQRIATLAYLTDERKAAFDAIGAERRAAFSDLDRQKLDVVHQIEELRGQIIGDVNRVIDRLVWRIAELCAGLLAATALLAFALLRFGRRTQPGA